MIKKILQLMHNNNRRFRGKKREIGHAVFEGQQVNKFQLTYYYQNV